LSTDRPPQVAPAGGDGASAFPDRPALALAFSLGASAGFAAMGVCVKTIGSEVGTPETVFARGAVGALLGLLLHLVLRVRVRVEAPFVLGLRVLAGTGSLVCYYGAIEGALSGGKGELATASMLLKTAPLWVALLAGWLLGEATSRRTWGALGVGLAGMALSLAGPEGAGGRSGVVLGLLSGIFAAFAYLSVRRLAVREDPLTVVTLFSLGTALLVAPFVFWRFAHAPVLPGPRASLLLGGVGLSGTLAQILMTHAYRHGKAAVVALSGLAEVAFNVLAGTLVFGERPSAWALAGSGLAVLAGLCASWPRRS